MLYDPKKKRLGSHTCACVFIGYVQNSIAYRFLVVKSDVLEYNIIIEFYNASFFEHIFPMTNKEKPIAISHDLSDNVVEENDHELKRCKRNRKETSFGDDFYTYLVTDD